MRARTSCPSGQYRSLWSLTTSSTTFTERSFKIQAGKSQQEIAEAAEDRIDSLCVLYDLLFKSCVFSSPRRIAVEMPAGQRHEHVLEARVARRQVRQLGAAATQFFEQRRQGDVRLGDRQ